ncbi:MAG TPA: RNA 2',3'-cyclic phosphodiesterase [Solimonas sp.]
MAEPNRLFFALWPTAEVREASQQAARDLKIRMQPTGYLSSAERYHITLLFLGDTVPPEREAAALQAAARVRAAPFDLTLDHAASFRTPQGFPWWLGMREPPAALRTLYEQLREAMVRGGAAPERLRFTPHLTILRDPRLALPPTAIKPIAWRVEEFVLIRSHLDRSPVEYELLGRWPLNAPPPPEPAAQLSLL